MSGIETSLDSKGNAAPLPFLFVFLFHHSLTAIMSTHAAAADALPVAAGAPAVAAAVMATGGAAAAAAPCASEPLEQRLQRTNRRIGQLLDQMSWREEDAERNQGAHAAAADGAVAVAAAQSSESSADTGASAPAAAAAVAAVPAPAPLLSSCRPLDRAAFLARVSTYSPLVWLHRPQTGAALSPLLLSRHGWVADSERRDGVRCESCPARLLLHFSPAVLSLPNAAAARSLARRYAQELVPTGHADRCPWALAPADLDFTRIVPGGVRSPSHAVSDSQRAVVLGQAEARANTLRKRAPAGLWHAFAVQQSFVDAARDLIRSRSAPAAAAADAVDAIDVATLLALCGWEMRTPAAATAAAAAPTQNGAASSAAAAASVPPSAVLQCCFGCRDVAMLDRFCTAPVIADGSKEQQEAAAAGANEDGGAAQGGGDGDGEEEERSIFQSPLKRRKVDEQSSRSAPAVGAASALGPKAPRVRSSPGGFHPVREHRPFCPFLQPLSDDDADADVDSAAPSVSALVPETKKRAYAPAVVDASPLLGWQQVLVWWCERAHAKLAQERHLADSDPIGSASGVAAALSAVAPTSTLVQKEQQFHSAIATVRKLLRIGS